MMKIRKIKLNGKPYLVQSFKQGSHANIISDSERLSFTIDLKNKKVDGSYGMQTEYWREKANGINIDELIFVLNNR